MTITLESIQAVRREGSDTFDAALVIGTAARRECFNTIITTVPVVSLEAPSSLHTLLQGCDRGTHLLMEALAQWCNGVSLQYPIELGTAASSTQTAPDAPLWPSDSRSKAHLGIAELTWSARHLSLERSNSLFPRPPEYAQLWHERDDLLPVAIQADLLTHTAALPRTIVAPKATTGTRIASQLDPLDALLLTGIVRTCGELVERARLPTADGIVHSFRYEPQDWGQIWNPEVGFHSFDRESDHRASASSVNHVIEADIESFYHSASPLLIGQQLERMNVHPRLAESASRILNQIAQKGLPVGPSVSAFFAEVLLASIDRDLVSRRVQFTRFNDDFRIFGRSKAQAEEQLQILADVLRGRNLRLRPEKTRSVPATQYLDERDQSRNWWLRQLGDENAEPKPYGTHTDETWRASPSAKSVLFKSIAETHDAWTKLARSAFRALLPHEKPSVIPQLMLEIDRIWPMASDIATTLRALHSRLHMDLSDSIAKAFVDGARSTRSDFAFVWILDAFSRTHCAGREHLVELVGTIPVNSVSRRELGLALGGVVDRPWELVSTTDSWNQYCRAWLGDQSMPLATDTVRSRFASALLHSAFEHARGRPTLDA